MLTNNGKILLKLIMYMAVNKSFNNTHDTSGINETLINWKGATCDYKTITWGNLFPDRRSYTFSARNSKPDYNSGVYFGTGSTAPTVNDYVIDYIEHNDTINKVSGRSYNDENGDTYFDIIYSYKNNNANEITIREFGIFSGTQTVDRNFLIYRDVLDTPVTIAPGETKNIKLTIKMSW